MATKKRKTNPKVKPKATAVQSKKVRRLKAPEYRSFRLSKRIKHPVTLPGAFRLFKRSLGMLRDHWKIIGGIVLVYGVLNLLLVRGVGNGLDLQGTKKSIEETLQNGPGRFVSGVTLFSILLQTAGQATDPAAGVYQTLLIILVSLALIWALRQVLAGTKITIREAYYKGMYPLVPFIAVMAIIGLQLLPIIVGSTLYNVVHTNGIAVTATEEVIWALIFFFFALFSIYMVCSSIFALYIVTLPDMTPMKAVRSARQLVRFRRWTIMRKVLFLPLAILVLGCVLMLPVIIFLTPIAETVFFIGTTISLALIHSYMYTLYRELL